MASRPFAFAEQERRKREEEEMRRGRERTLPSKWDIGFLCKGKSKVSFL
jgi:hypothetical protein